MLETKLSQVVPIALVLQLIFQYKLMNIFSIKCDIINLKIDVTKNRTFSEKSLVKSKSEIHSPGSFHLMVQDKEVIKVSLQLSWQLSYHSNEEYG